VLLLLLFLLVIVDSMMYIIYECYVLVVVRAQCESGCRIENAF
jgi:hypothetical protein